MGGGVPRCFDTVGTYAQHARFDAFPRETCAVRLCRFELEVVLVVSTMIGVAGDVQLTIT